MSDTEWIDLGSAEELSRLPLQEVTAGRRKLALTFQDGAFGAIAGACNHVGGPLGQGRLVGEYVVCPWHYWKFHCRTGEGEPGYEADKVPRYTVKVEGGRVLVDLASATQRARAPHAPHPLARTPERASGALRVVGISTTAMTREHPRFSGSDHLLTAALARAEAQGAETRHLKLSDLQFRACEGYYSKAARACTWPCSITQMDPKDEMEQVYEALVHWADVFLVATPIRWGAPSSLYAKMVERLNCVQNQETIAHRQLLQNKVAAFFVVGGQDNVQAVVGQMLTFFAEIGCHFPAYPFVAHSRGWSAEDMENNVSNVRESTSLREGAEALADRALALAETLLTRAPAARARGGRKACRLEDPASDA